MFKKFAQNFPNIWAIFVIKFVTKKSPNQVTLLSALSQKMSTQKALFDSKLKQKWAIKMQKINNDELYSSTFVSRKNSQGLEPNTTEFAFCPARAVSLLNCITVILLLLLKIEISLNHLRQSLSVADVPKRLAQNALDNVCWLPNDVPRMKGQKIGDKRWLVN